MILNLRDKGETTGQDIQSLPLTVHDTEHFIHLFHADIIAGELLRPVTAGGVGVLHD